MTPRRTAMFSLILGATLIGAAVRPTLAATPFDGPWAVTIMTEAGQCDAAYRYAVVVTGGRVISDIRESTGTIAISGKIAADGRVSVNVSRGGRRADGTGKLSETTGAGTWVGKTAHATTCSGRWEARRN